MWNLIKYYAISTGAFIIEYLLFLLLKKYIHYIIANAIIYSITFWAIFLANKFLAFESQGNFIRQLLQFTVLYFVNLIVTTLMLLSLSELAHIDAAYGKFIVSAISCIWNFFLYKYVIYTK